MNRIDAIRIRGFRSLADVELTGLPDTTVLIGANGSGKSNFIRFFEMVSWMLRAHQLREFVAKHGGASDQLFGGNRRTNRMEAELSLRTDVGRNDYRFALAHAHPDRLIFTEEAFRFSSEYFSTEAEWQHLGVGHEEAEIVETAQTGNPDGVNRKTASVVVHLLRNCAAFQFHDTSDSSNFKKAWDVSENKLRLIQQDDIREHFRRQVQQRDECKKTQRTIGCQVCSEGLVPPFDSPSQHGLHPAAIALVANMIKSLATERQVIVATQSPLLVYAFGLDEIVVLELCDGQTEFCRLNADDYRSWLDDSFTTGELWQKNLIGGRP